MGVGGNAAAGRIGLPAKCRCQSRTRSLRRGSEMSVFDGRRSGPGGTASARNEKAAEERPLIGERTGPYAMGRTLLAGRLAPERGPAEVVSEEHHQHRTAPFLFLDLREGGLQMVDES